MYIRYCSVDYNIIHIMCHRRRFGDVFLFIGDRPSPLRLDFVDPSLPRERGFFRLLIFRGSPFGRARAKRVKGYPPQIISRIFSILRLCSTPVSMI